MESSLTDFDITMSGQQTSEYTLLFSDLFNLFPGTFQNVIKRYENRYRILDYKDSGFDLQHHHQKLRHTSIDGYADELIQWLQQNGVNNVVYIAHSVNALLAFTVAAKAPHLIKKIVLSSACPYLLADPKTHYLCGFEAASINDLFKRLVQKDATALLDKLPHNHTVQLTDILSRAFSHMDVESAHQIFNLLLSSDCRKYLSELQIPTVILQVSADCVATNEAGYLMYRTIPNSQFVKIKAKGQLPQVEAPEQMVQAMNLFINATAC